MIIAITLIAGVFIFSMYLSTKGLSSGKQILSTLDRSVEKERIRTQELRAQVELSNDSFIQEKIQHDELLQSKPGEIVLQLPVLVVPSPTPMPSPDTVTPWSEWKKVLFSD
jgi:hypothetical protein